MSVFKHEWHLTALVPHDSLYSQNCVYLKQFHFTFACMSLTMHPLLWTNDTGKGYETSNTHFVQWVKLFNSTLILHHKLHIGIQYTFTHPWIYIYIFIHIYCHYCVLLWTAWKKFKLVYTYLEIQEASMTYMLLILTSWMPKRCILYRN